MKQGKKINAFFEVIGQCLVIRISDDLDHHKVLSLRDEADGLIEKERIKNIIFDFNGVSFMDSSGIGLIMGRYKLINSLGGTLHVVNVSAQAHKVMTLAGLESLATITEAEVK